MVVGAASGSVVRVLVTGAAGQVGREVVEVFERAGHHEVAAATRKRLDLADRDSVVGAITATAPDVVVHCGAWTAVDACEGDPDRALLVNALGTRHVVDGARRCGATVVYVSTDYVFDGTLDRPYDEWDAPNPQSAYGRSKLGGERELRPEDTIVRTSWLFGRYGANMVKTVLRLAETNPELAFVDDQYGKPTCAADLAEVLYELAVGRRPGVFHVTNDGATTWYEFARTVLDAAGESPDRVRPITTAELQPPRPAPRPVNSVLDNAACRLEGLSTPGDHREAVARVVHSLTSGGGQ